MKILKNYQIFKVSSNPQQGLQHRTRSPPPPQAAPEHHWGENIYMKTRQVYCAWLIKWVVKIEIIQLAELCPMKWWIIRGTWWHWVSIIGIIPKKYNFFSASLAQGCINRSIQPSGMESKFGARGELELWFSENRALVLRELCSGSQSLLKGSQEQSFSFRYSYLWHFLWRFKKKLHRTCEHMIQGPRSARWEP